MNEETERLKNDLQIIENAAGLNLWTRRDVRRGLLGVLGGGAAGLLLAIWSARNFEPQGGLLLFLAILSAIIVAKGIGFGRQPAPAPGSRREITFYNRFYSVGGALAGCTFIWAQGRGMDPLSALAITIVMAGSWYLFYALSAPSRWISLGGAVPLTACGFLLPGARNFPEAICWLGIATCVGCWAEAVFLLAALRPPYSPPSDAISPARRRFRHRPTPRLRFAMLPIDFNGLDTAIHGPTRLGVMTALQMDGALDFSTLKTRLQVADGSLNLHLRTLEEAGYIRSRKAIVGLRPKTTYAMTAVGRRALVVYLQAMRKLLSALDREGA